MTKFSILGIGNIGRIHKAAIEETEEAVLESVIDPTAVQEDYSVPVYASLEEFLEKDRGTDVVVIATPNGFHKKHAVSCLNAGKNVLIEKPIALSMQEAKEILMAAERNGKRVFSSMQLRFSPPVSLVKSLLEENKLGEIFMVNIDCYWNRNPEYYRSHPWRGTAEMDGGVLFTQFSHFIDILNFWFKEVECNDSSFYNFTHRGITEFPDSGKVNFTADGAQGNMIFTTSVFEKNFDSHILILAEKGTVKISGQYLNSMEYFNVETMEPSEDMSTEIKNFHPKAISEVAAALEEGRPSVLDGEHAVRLIEFIECAHQKSGI